MFLAFVVLRVAFVQAFATKDPARVEAIWPAHPTVMLEAGLAEIGELAAAGKPIDKQLVDRLVSTSARAPLAPEPFLVRGVDAQVAGDQQRALRAFLAARQRNPRDVATRYFLSDLYLKAGLTGPGLSEVSTLARLVPDSRSKIAPYLAAYAQTPSAAPQVKEVLKAHPQLESALLNDLASDASKAGLVLYLWSGQRSDEPPPWQGRLLTSLVDAGRYQDARSAWARFTGASASSDQAFDTNFSANVMPPFGWKLESGKAGVAETLGQGRLHVLYYGRDDLVLASQLMTLPPGRYRLSMEIAAGASPAKSLGWKVQCLPGRAVIASLPLNAPGVVSAAFAVPAGGCNAQRLELTGTAPDFPAQAEATIGKLRLAPEAGR